VKDREGTGRREVNKERRRKEKRSKNEGRQKYMKKNE
jgi:hypothetical protein